MAQGINGREFSPLAAVLLSFLWPGLGQFYKGASGKGTFMSVGYFSCLILFFLTAWIYVGFLFLPVLFIIWIWSMADAGASNK